MEYHEVQRLINRYKSTITTDRSSGFHDEGDHSALDYSSDESFDSHPSTFLQHFIPTATKQSRRYYPVPTASPLPQKEQSWQIISKPIMTKRGSSTSLSMKFVQGVHLLKHKVVSLSSSSGISFTTSNDSICSSSDDTHSLTHKIPASSEIYTHTRYQEPQIPTVYQLAPPQCSPIPKLAKHQLRRSSPPQRWKPRTHPRPSAAFYGLFSSTRNKRSRVRKRLDSILKRRLFKSVIATPTSPATTTTTTTTTTTRAIQSPSLTRLTPHSKSKVHYDHLKPKINPHTLRTASTLLIQLSEKIQRLECLVDIKVQSVEDHQRDIDFYTSQLDQLNHHVQYMNKKVVGLSTQITTDPLHDELQRILPLLGQLLTQHHQIVKGFTRDVLRHMAKNTFYKLQSEIKSGHYHIQRWDLITHWTFFGSLILLVSILGFFLIQAVSPWILP